MQTGQRARAGHIGAMRVMIRVLLDAGWLTDTRADAEAASAMTAARHQAV
ncbi:hypothetical protein ACF08M_29640 [Streptomyces sp. NPDC015032]